MSFDIPFNRPYAVGTEGDAVMQAIARGHISADGAATRACRGWLRDQTGAAETVLMHSCTAALEASALLLDLKAGDEVILPSYTFVTSASAFSLRGATPVFVDVRPDTLNIDETLIEAAITPATKAIVVVHYAGVGSEMEAILEIAERHGLAVVEDAAQGVLATWHGRPLGTFGALGTLSFHETKNVTCGEGGALLINDRSLIEGAFIVKDKGTNRAQFLAGLADKYTWVAHGSSYGLSDLNAAFLWEQLQHAEEITRMRLAIWERYHAAFADLEEEGLVRRPFIPEGAEHNAHMYYLIVGSRPERDRLLGDLKARGVHCVFHYVPLHSSPAGRRLGRPSGELPVTEDLAHRLMRIPLWAGMADEEVDYVIEEVRRQIAGGRPVTTSGGTSSRNG
jgi:dTDP-4-amino-4,6-dideoxygalactose transaminase